MKSFSVIVRLLLFLLHFFSFTVRSNTSTLQVQGAVGRRRRKQHDLLWLDSLDVESIDAGERRRVSSGADSVMATAAAPPPPRPAPKPGRVRVYRALYDYEARTDQEMTFAEGDLLYVSDRGPNDDWLPATCGGKKGLVPANYVVSENVEELSNPLHEAARRGNLLFLKDCIANQVSVNSLDKSGSTALYWACHGGHVDIVKHLLEHPTITVSSQNKLGDTPLHAASWRGHRDCLQLLLAAGANAWIRNREQKLPIDVAKDAEVAGLLDQAMRRDTRNEDCDNEYESGSDDEQ